MNRRQIKKLCKRRGFFKYSKYKEWKRILDFGVKHGGQWFYEWFVEGKHRTPPDRGFDVLLITTSPSGKEIKHIKVAQDVVPGTYDSKGCTTDDTEIRFNVNFHNGLPDEDWFSDIYNKYQEWIKGGSNLEDGRNV